MTPEERELLLKTHDMVEENNKILRSLRNGQRWDRVLKYGYWVVIIALSFGAYYFIQPFMESFGVGGQSFRSPANDTQRVSQIQDLLKGI